MLEKNCPIEIFANKLQGRIAESTGDAPTNSTALSRTETIAAEGIAREEGMWVPFSEVSSLGTPFPSGVENDVYLNPDGNVIYKVNNLMTSKTITALLDRLTIHNSIFPQTFYRLHGFTGFGSGSIYPILVQDFVPNEREATPIEIDTYMAALGFTKTAEATYDNGQIEVSDLRPRNVLRDTDGDLFVVDAEFRRI